MSARAISDPTIMSFAWSDRVIVGVAREGMMTDGQMHGNKSCSNLMAFSIHSLGLKGVPKASEISASYAFAFVTAGARERLLPVWVEKCIRRLIQTVLASITVNSVA